MKLIIEDDEGRKTVVPFVRDEITIGRQEGNTIRLTERNVSRKHAKLLRQSGTVLIEDVGSSYGIRVNGDKISGQVKIADGDLIQIGDYDLAIQREESASTQRTEAATVPLDTTPRPSSPSPKSTANDHSATAPTLPPVNNGFKPTPKAAAAPSRPEPEEPAAPAEDDRVPAHQATAVIRIDQVQGAKPLRSVVELDSSEAPRLMIVNTELAGREFAVTKTEIRIGRVEDNDIAIDHRSLSRTHCKIVREDNGEWRVVDMQSANGLMVNGEPYAQVTLRGGDVIELGHVKLKFLTAGQTYKLPAGVGSPQPASPTGDLDEPTPPSSAKAPVLAIVAALAVVIVLGGGYAIWKSSRPAAGGAKPVADGKPGDSKPNDSTKPSADEAQEAADIVAKAQAAAEKGDFSLADTLLRACKVGGAPCPQGAALRSTLEAEKPNVTALDEAEKALGRGDLDAVDKQMEILKSSKLLAAKVADLQGRYNKLLREKVKNPGPAAKDPAKDPKPVAAAGDPAEEWLQKGIEALDKKDLDQGRAMLDKCLKINPNQLVCIRKLASTVAKIGSRDNSAADTDRARQLYERYVKVAPPDDQYIEKIQRILHPE